MKINLNATRINNGDTDVSISFSEIRNDHFRLVKTEKIENTKNEVGVIFQITNDSRTTIDRAGTDTMSFKAKFDINTNKIRVFYWNDGGLLSTDIDCFRDFLELNGLDENIPIGDFSCEKSSTKSIHIPRQAGNGGVLGITNLP